MIAGLQALAVSAALAGGPGSVGAGIQPGPVCAATTVQPGHSYVLPPVGVNTGSAGTEQISLYVTRQTPGSGHLLPGLPVPPSWVQFTYPRGWWGLAGQSSVRVDPGTQKLVPAILAIPSSAPPGSYVSWIVAGPPGTSPAQVHLSAAAIADFEFTVVPPGSPSRPGPCVTPGVKHHPKPAKPAGQAGHRRAHRPAAAASDGPASWGHNPKTYAIIAGVAVGGTALIVPRRRRR